jgi:glycosyltransferase involved in cell wall biosynthesis
MSLSYSVVIPAFNAAATIRAAIDSVLAQSVPPRAIIVVDDGSTDDTAALAAGTSGPVIVIRQENKGPGAATTAGLRQVSTPFFAGLDADDLWLPSKIAAQASVFGRDPGVSGVFTRARLFHDGAPLDPNGGGAARSLWGRTTLLYRTAAARAIGDVVDPPGRMGEMIDWLARGRDLGHRHVMLEEVLALRRVRPGSLSYGRDPERTRGYLFVVRAAMERRRRGIEAPAPTDS